ncbi:MAG TPA: hypothetical protein PKZ08_16345, partial [Vicinamibacterales bacterium]|nr:hypothetical protein [Vicinamibacterales bacterium]
SYLHHQGDTFTKRFDANSYLYITKAIDYFDLTKDGSLTTGFSGVKAAFLVISVSSDWLYPPRHLEAAARAARAAGRAVTYREILSDCGHDAFLLEHEAQGPLIREFLDGSGAVRSAAPLRSADAGPARVAPPGAAAWRAARPRRRARPSGRTGTS